jgi:hypothetical protein
VAGLHVRQIWALARQRFAEYEAEHVSTPIDLWVVLVIVP